MYNELREEQIRDKKRAGPVLLQDDGRDTSKSDRLKEIEAAISKAKQAESRKAAAESRVAELRAKVGSDTAETEAPATPSESNGQKTYLPGAEKYPDFAEAMADADKAQLTVPDRAATAIKAARNRADVVYYLARNPEVCRELWDNPDSATQNIGEISRALLNADEESRRRRQQQSLRPQELLQAHNQRILAARKADPDAAAAVDAAANLPISHTVISAVLEQENSDALVIHFAKNPKVLEELNELPPSAAMSRVGRIAEQIASNAAAKRERAKPPSPITPVGNSSSRTGLSLDDPSVPISVYIRERNKQEAQRRRGR